MPRKPRVRDLKKMVTVFGKPAYVARPRLPRLQQEWVGKWILEWWHANEESSRVSTHIFSSLREAKSELLELRDKYYSIEWDLKPYKPCRHCKGSGNIAHKLIMKGRRR